MKKCCFFIFTFTLASCALFRPNDYPNPSPDPPTEEPDDPIEPIEGTATFEQWTYQPFHPGNNQPVTFFLKAEENTPVQRVELLVYEFELFLDDDFLPSSRRRNGGSWGVVESWDFPPNARQIDLSHFFAPGFPARSQVAFVFRITNTAGGVSERMARFDAGTSPWPSDKILLYATGFQPMRSTINLCLLPDTDYQNNWQQFLADTRQLIFDGFHQSNMIRDHKAHWSFYYTRQSAHGPAIAQNFTDPNSYPDFLRDSIIQGIDAFALLHLNEYSDGAYLNSNIHFLAQNLFTSESYNLGTAVHESAHAIFDLSDEYNGCACFETTTGSNVFQSLSACRAFNIANGFSPDECHQIENYENVPWYISEASALFGSREACENFNRSKGYPPESCGLFIDIDGRRLYRSSPALCIMMDDGDRLVPDFQRTCSTIIQRYYDGLPDGRELAMTDDHPNIFDYEMVVMMEMEVDGNTWKAIPKEVTYGVPAKNLVKRKELRMELLDDKGKTVFSMPLSRPDCQHIHFRNRPDQLDVQGSGKVMVAVPYKAELAEVICRYDTDEQLAPYEGVDRVRVFRQRIDADIKRQHSNFRKRKKKRN